jgi:hypothetical protein
VYNECKEYLAFYEKRYEQLLKYYANRTQVNEETYIKRQIFLTWKYEYVTAKRVFTAINRVFTRKFLKEPKELLMKEFKHQGDKNKSQLLLADILGRKGERTLAKAMHLWKVNLYKMKLHEIELRLEHLDEYE